MISVSKLAATAIAVVGGAALLIGGAAVGHAVALHEQRATEVTAAEPAPCNLRITWDRGSQEYLAVYEDSTWVSKTGDYGRTANLSCTDDEILAWQHQRRENNLDPEVCRPVLRAEVTGIVRSIGCAVPTLVATDEPR
ncbi:hypothetical protein [Microbacterium sp.]|uniref:hypothetical protein n=1 Tax=Microbacterium sp. TaxID=51671 RepID=UPI0028112E33|nr:hypothetical protein [Microbacterium sp.]